MFLGLSSALTSVRRNFLPWIKDGLKLYYPFSKNSDYKISHASSGSTSFDGSDDYVTNTSFTGHQSSTGTLSCWGKPSDVSGWQYFMSVGGSTTTGATRGIAISDANLYFIGYSENWDTTVDLTADTWYHLALTWDGTSIIMYVNGVGYSQTMSNLVTPTNSIMDIGASAWSNGNFINGSICNVGIWSRALSASEIQGIMYKKYADLSTADQVSLVSWYGLDEDYTDSHGSNDGTNSGSTLTNSVYGGNAPSKPRILDSAPDVVDNYGTLHSGTALSFDGTNDYVDTGMTSIPEDGTISVWIKTDSQAREMIIGSVGTYTYKFGINYKAGTGGAQIGYVSLMPDYGTLSAYVNIGANLYDGNWHYITGQWDGSASTIKIYFDGKEQTVAYTNQSVWSSQTNTYSLAIGAYNASTKGAYFTGLISSSKLFDVALTLAQIQEMYLNPEQILPTGVSSSNLKLWLPLQEGSGTTNYDGSGNNNDGTISGATWVKAETEIAQVGLVRQNKPMVFDGSDDVVSISDNSAIDFGTGDFTLSAWIKTSGDGWMRIVDKRDASSGYTFNVDTSEMIHLELNDGGGNTGYSASTDISDDLWHHIVASADRSGNVTFYLDGSSDGTADISAKSGSIDSTSDLFIGADAPGGDSLFFDGNINEVAIWDEALTATEVTALYNSGTPLDASADSGNYASSDGLQGYWRNDGDTTWTDRSTNSNHGTVAGSPASIVLTEGITSGRDSQGFYLKDTDENVLTLNGAEYVEVGSAMSYTNHTISGWFNLSELGSNRIVFDARDANDDGIRLMHNWGGLFYYQLNGSDVTKTTPSINEWIHIACTYDGTTQKLYFDGVLESSATTSQVVSTTVNAVIGSLSYGSKADSWKGLLDDIKVYSDALSATEVEKNYNSGKSSHL